MNAELADNAAGQTGCTGKKRRWFFVWLIPLLWEGVSLGARFHSGDEHGLLVIGGMAGFWICFFIESARSIDFPALWPVFLTGGIVMAICGSVMDLLKVSRKLWLCIFVACIAAVFGLVWMSFPSFEEMRWKHGSVLAIVLFSANFSLYASFLITSVAAAVRNMTARRKNQTSDISLETDQ